MERVGSSREQSLGKVFTLPTPRTPEDSTEEQIGT